MASKDGGQAVISFMGIERGVGGGRNSNREQYPRIRRKKKTIRILEMVKPLGLHEIRAEILKNRGL